MDKNLFLLLHCKIQVIPNFEYMLMITFKNV